MSRWQDEPIKKEDDTEKKTAMLARKHDFNMKAAEEAGYSKEEIGQHLSIKESIQDAHIEIIMCPPLHLDTKISNNRWMRALSEEEKEINIDKAVSQFFNVYSLLSQDAIVYLLPPKKGLQDQVYISNAGALLPHLHKTIVLSNFTAPGRPGEEKVLGKFLDLTDLKQHECPYKFEGEAEFKWIRDNIYIGGYGMRSNIKAFQWMEKEFDCKIIYLKMTDELRYHLDCVVFPINKECVLVATDAVEPKTVKEIEAVAEVIPVGKKDSQMSLTNCVRVNSVVYNATGISEMKVTDKDYQAEKHKNDALEKIVADKGLSMVWVNLSEMQKSGAALSCMVMHKSRIAYPAS